VGVLATGYNIVDTAAAAERGIPVTNVPAYGTPAVTQMVFAHLLNLCNHVEEHGAGVRQGKWSRAEDFCYWEHPLVEIAGRTLGIVGLGRIGASVARAALGFGMRILAHDPAVDSAPPGVVLSDLETVFRESDVVSLHCPLTEQNRGFVGDRLLRLMKPGAFFINTSRGPLVDEPALARALNDGAIAGAGLDVLTEEPPASDCPLLAARNCTITPHIAWATVEARRRLMTTAFENLRAFLDGDRLNVVNGL
jgi:glycerate dehydrogenase